MSGRLKTGLRGGFKTSQTHVLIYRFFPFSECFCFILTEVVGIIVSGLWTGRTGAEEGKGGRETDEERKWGRVWRDAGGLQTQLETVASSVSGVLPCGEVTKPRHPWQTSVTYATVLRFDFRYKYANAVCIAPLGWGERSLIWTETRTRGQFLVCEHRSSSGKKDVGRNVHCTEMDTVQKLLLFNTYTEIDSDVNGYIILLLHRSLLLMLPL